MLASVEISAEGSSSGAALTMSLFHSDEALRCTAHIEDPALKVEGQIYDYITSVEEGNFERAASALKQVELMAHELDPALRWAAMFVAAAWKLMHGDLLAGERLSQGAMQVGRDDFLQIYGVQLTFARRYQGRGAEIIEAVEQNVDAYPRIASWRAGLPWMLCAVDRRADAKALLEQAASDGFEHLTQMQTGLTALALYADVAVETRSSDAAATLHRLMEPWADQFVFTTSCGYGHVRMWLGCSLVFSESTSRPTSILRSLASSTKPMACRYGWHGVTSAGAEALAARGDVAGARDHAARALELSREHGYGLFEERAAALVAPESAAETDGR